MYTRSGGDTPTLLAMSAVCTAMHAQPWLMLLAYESNCLPKHQLASMSSSVQIAGSAACPVYPIASVGWLPPQRSGGSTEPIPGWQNPSGRVVSGMKFATPWGFTGASLSFSTWLLAVGGSVVGTR